MLESKVLETFSPILIPFSFLIGINLVEVNLIYQKFSLIGSILFVLSLMILYDRVEDPKDETRLVIGNTLFAFGYLTLTYSPLFYYTGSLIFLAGCIMIAESIIDNPNIYNYRHQYVYISLASLYFYLGIAVPYSRNNLSNIHTNLIIPLFFYTVLVISTIKLPFNTSLK